jgi:hypothetical protein
VSRSFLPTRIVLYDPMVSSVCVQYGTVQYSGGGGGGGGGGGDFFPFLATTEIPDGYPFSGEREREREGGRERGGGNRVPLFLVIRAGKKGV